MRIQSMIMAAFLFLGLGLTACTHHDSGGQDQSAAREAGRAAYNVTQKSKKAAEKAGQELKKAAKEARAGWNDAKRDAQDKDKK